MPGAATRKIAAEGIEKIRREPFIEVIPHTEELREAALRQLLHHRRQACWLGRSRLSRCPAVLFQRSVGLSDRATIPGTRFGRAEQFGTVGNHA